MRRITYWALSTISAVALLFGYSTSTSGPTGTSSSLSSGAVISASGTSGSTSSQPSGSGQTSAGSGSGDDPSSSPSTITPATPSMSPDSTVTGAVASTQWGPVQVQLVVSGGTITNVSVLQYPSGNGRDQEINAYALPILTQETIDAQSANIDMVSGATVTSDGYLTSLQSALDQANL